MWVQITALALLLLAASTKAEIKDALKTKANRSKSWFSDENRFRYDIECRWLRTEERVKRISEGRCPPLPTTTDSGCSAAPALFPSILVACPSQQLVEHRGDVVHQLLKGSCSHSEAGTRFHSAGGMKIENIDLDTDSTISWYVNNEEIKNQRFDWRVTISAEGILNIWPLMEEDAGHYECAVDGGIMGSALINVISKSDAVMNGLYNYFYVALFYIPVAVYAVILVSRDLTKPPRKSKREDKMAAFLEEHVLKNGQDVKENIAKIIYGDQFEERKEEITKTMAAGVAPNGEKVRGNHETVMTLLCGPKSKQSEGAKKKPKRVQKAVGKNQDLTYQSVMPRVDPSRLDNTFQHEFRHFIR